MSTQPPIILPAVLPNPSQCTTLSAPTMTEIKYEVNQLTIKDAIRAMSDSLVHSTAYYNGIPNAGSTGYKLIIGDMSGAIGGVPNNTPFFTPGSTTASSVIFNQQLFDAGSNYIVAISQDTSGAVQPTKIVPEYDGTNGTFAVLDTCSNLLFDMSINLTVRDPNLGTPIPSTNPGWTATLDASDPLIYQEIYANRNINPVTGAVNNSNINISLNNCYGSANSNRLSWGSIYPITIDSSTNQYALDFNNLLCTGIPGGANLVQVVLSVTDEATSDNPAHYRTGLYTINQSDYYADISTNDAILFENADCTQNFPSSIPGSTFKNWFFQSNDIGMNFEATVNNIGNVGTGYSVVSNNWFDVSSAVVANVPYMQAYDFNQTVNHELDITLGSFAISSPVIAVEDASSSVSEYLTVTQSGLTDIVYILDTSSNKRTTPYSAGATGLGVGYTSTIVDYNLLSDADKLSPSDTFSVQSIAESVYGFVRDSSNFAAGTTGYLVDPSLVLVVDASTYTHLSDTVDGFSVTSNVVDYILLQPSALVNRPVANNTNVVTAWGAPGVTAMTATVTNQGGGLYDPNTSPYATDLSLCIHLITKHIGNLGGFTEADPSNGWFFSDQSGNKDGLIYSANSALASSFFKDYNDNLIDGTATLLTPVTFAVAYDALNDYAGIIARADISYNGLTTQISQTTGISQIVGGKTTVGRRTNLPTNGPPYSTYDIVYTVPAGKVLFGMGPFTNVYINYPGFDLSLNYVYGADTYNSYLIIPHSKETAEYHIVIPDDLTAFIGRVDNYATGEIISDACNNAFDVWANTSINNPASSPTLSVLLTGTTATLTSSFIFTPPGDPVTGSIAVNMTDPNYYIFLSNNNQPGVDVVSYYYLPSESNEFILDTNTLISTSTTVDGSMTSIDVSYNNQGTLARLTTIKYDDFQFPLSPIGIYTAWDYVFNIAESNSGTFVAASGSDNNSATGSVYVDQSNAVALSYNAGLLNAERTGGITIFSDTNYNTIFSLINDKSYVQRLSDSTTPTIIPADASYADISGQYHSDPSGILIDASHNKYLPVYIEYYRGNETQLDSSSNFTYGTVQRTPTTAQFSISGELMNLSITKPAPSNTNIFTLGTDQVATPLVQNSPFGLTFDFNASYNYGDTGTYTIDLSNDEYTTLITNPYFVQANCTYVYPDPSNNPSIQYARNGVVAIIGSSTPTLHNTQPGGLGNNAQKVYVNSIYSKSINTFDLSLNIPNPSLSYYPTSKPVISSAEASTIVTTTTPSYDISMVLTNQSYDISGTYLKVGFGTLAPPQLGTYATQVSNPQVGFIESVGPAGQVEKYYLDIVSGNTNATYNPFPASGHTGITGMTGLNNTTFKDNTNTTFYQYANGNGTNTSVDVLNDSSYNFALNAPLLTISQSLGMTSATVIGPTGLYNILHSGSSGYFIGATGVIDSSNTTVKFYQDLSLYNGGTGSTAQANTINITFPSLIDPSGSTYSIFGKAANTVTINAMGTVTNRDMYGFPESITANLYKTVPYAGNLYNLSAVGLPNGLLVDDIVFVDHQSRTYNISVDPTNSNSVNFVNTILDVSGGAWSDITPYAGASGTFVMVPLNTAGQTGLNDLLTLNTTNNLTVLAVTANPIRTTVDIANSLISEIDQAGNITGSMVTLHE